MAIIYFTRRISSHKNIIFIPGKNIEFDQFKPNN